MSQGTPVFQKSHIWAFIGAIAIFLIILALPTPEALDTPEGPVNLTREGKAALATLALCVILWATEAIPFAVTGLLGIVLMVVTKVETLEKLVQWGFGNTIIVFFLGVLLFSAAISETNLLKRVTTFMLYHLGNRPKAIVATFLVLGALLSGWITDMAVAAMFLPIGVSVLKDAKVEPLKSNFGKAVMIACSWGPLMGGVATPAGCGPNPLTIGFLKELAGIDFTFRDWILIGYPATFLMLPLGWFVLVKVFPVENVNIQMASQDFKKRLEELGPLSRKEIFTLIIFATMIILWVFPDQIEALTGGVLDFLDIRFVALACALLFFIPGIGVIKWERAESTVSWGGIILVVAGLALGKAVHATGAASWLSYVAFSKLGILHPIVMIFAVVLGVSLLKVIFSSNTVTGAIMVPLLIALAHNLGLDPALVAIPAGITASLAFILVTSTPTNVIPYSAGYYSIKDMVKAGLIFTPISSACVTASIVIMGPLFDIVTW